MRTSFVISLLLASTSAIRLSHKQDDAAAAEPKDLEGYSDTSFQPHPILGNTLHKDQLEKIPAVARNEHIGQSVWHSSVEGGEPNPEKRRDIIGKEPMFSYPTKQTPDPDADPSSHGVQIEEPVGAKIMASAITAAKANEAKFEAAELKEAATEAEMAKEQGTVSGKIQAALTLAQQDGAAPVDLEGYSDTSFQPHPILKNTLHKDQLEKIPAVARNEHIGDSVWHSSVEGGEPNPEKRRDLIGKEPMFSYPTKQTPDPNAPPANNGMPLAEEPVGAKIMTEAINAAKAKEAKIAEVEVKAKEAAAAAAKKDAVLSEKVAKAMSLAQNEGIELQR